MTANISKGNLVVAKGTRKRATVSGEVVRIGRVNATVRSTVRFRPDGPWYTHEHKIPLCDLERL